MSAAQKPLRISLPLAKPMGYRDPDGTPRGFVVEALNAAALRAGLTLSWLVVGDMRANNSALKNNEIDLVAGLNTEERRRTFFVTDPWWSFDLILLAHSKASLKESDFKGKRIAIPVGAGPDVAAHFPGSIVTSALTASATVEAVCKGAADAGVIESMFLRELLFAASPACSGVSLQTIDSSVRVEYILAATMASADAARSLKAALDAITADGTLVSIAARHPPISTPHAVRLEELIRVRYQRKTLAIAAAAAVIILLLGALFAIRQIRTREQLNGFIQRLNEDLRARKQAEMAHRQSEARFRTLFDSAPQTVIAIDNSGVIAFANQKSHEMFNRPILVGSGVQTLFAERFRAIAHQDLAGISDMAGLRADGTEFPVEIYLGNVQTNEGLTLAFITDVSERVGLQQQLLQSQKLEGVGQLAGGVAHDFNNLLTIIIGYAQILLEDAQLPSFAREPVQQIDLAAERAAVLTRQLLTFSRRQKTNPKVLSLNDLLHNLHKMLERLIGEDIELILNTEEIGLVHADSGNIEQVVMNLAVNARDAMPNGGRLIIETRNFEVDSVYRSGHNELSPGNYVMLRVTDTGTGIAPEVKAHMFEPFFTTKEKGKGTGLGLSTVYGIVKQSGGEILVYSELGKGTTFKILLPVTDSPVTQESEVHQIVNSTGNETILLAEDEPGVRVYVRDVLTSNGYTVLEAVNGQDAVEVFERHSGPIHLLLSDMIMPLIRGPELAARLKQLHPNVAILHMSGYTDWRIGPDEKILLEKPFTPSALLRQIREVLDHHAPEAKTLA